ncbi:MAG: cation-translocating P-type ATPase [Candidatus Woesearchaeota archaeon]
MQRNSNSNDMTDEQSYHTISAGKTIDILKSSESGLTEKEAIKRLKQYGLNELRKEKDCLGLKIFISQFKSFLIFFLLFAIAISLLLGEIIDALAMTAILMLSTIMGFFQEYKAEKGIIALKKMAAPNARIVRNGITKNIPSNKLVPGDIVIISSGDIVPADIRIIESNNIRAMESSLTGESEPIKKISETLNKEVAISDQHNILFAGTQIVSGNGRGIIIRTGMETQLGRIASSLQQIVREETPLQKKFGAMGKQLGIGVIILVLIVFFTGILQNIGNIDIGEFIGYMLIFSLSLAVATIPSSLPAIVTIALSLGSRSLAKKNMIIKRLPAAESLGAVTIICSDKTGTLTRNEMTVTDLYLNRKHITVTGTGYEEKGEFYHDATRIGSDYLKKITLIGALCNNASVTIENGKPLISGNPTEASLIVLARKAGVQNDGYVRLGEIPFDSERKMMSVIYKTPEGKVESYVKGAPDMLIEKCTGLQIGDKIVPLTPKDKKAIMKRTEIFAQGSLRVLGAAYKQTRISAEYDSKSIENNLIFVGLFAMMDPPRSEAARAIEECKRAGIRVMMITGDHVVTARAVALKLGLLQKDDIILTGEDIDSMTDNQLIRKIVKVRIIARTLPSQKTRIVQALQHNNHVVAMTGDGVNDAPAIKKADIGIAMGVSGTDVTKDVAGGILLDDNFATIVRGVREGRNIFDKIVKTTRYLISCNVGEITLVFLAIMMKLPLPMLPLQLLLTSLVTDGLPGLALAAEPEDKDIMKRPPRNPREKPLTRQTIMMMLLFGITMGIGTLIVYYYFYITTANHVYARTIAFTTIVMFEMFAVFGARSLKPFQKLNPFTNPWIILAVTVAVSLHIMVVYLPPLQAIFGTTSIQLVHWIPIICVSIFGFIMSEAGKLMIKDSHTIEQKV